MIRMCLVCCRVWVMVVIGLWLFMVGFCQVGGLREVGKLSWCMCLSRVVCGICNWVVVWERLLCVWCKVFFIRLCFCCVSVLCRFLIVVLFIESVVLLFMVLVLLLVNVILFSSVLFFLCSNRLCWIMFFSCWMLFGQLQVSNCVSVCLLRVVICGLRLCVL